MERSKRNTAVLLIGAGIYLAVGSAAGYMTATALLLGGLGFMLMRSSEDPGHRNPSGYVLLAVAGMILIVNHWSLLLAAAAIGTIWFVMRAKNETVQGAKYVEQHIVTNVRWEKKEPWVLEATNISAAIAEIRMDLTKAVLEQEETTINLQGVIGDIDIVVPEDVGLSVNASVVFGQIQVAGEKGAGVMSRSLWRSPNFDAAPHKILLIVSYAVADVDVKVV